MKNKLIRLASEGGISGFEFSISDVVVSLLTPYCQTVEVDHMGNVIGVIPSSCPDAKKVMLEAHIDGFRY